MTEVYKAELRSPDGSVKCSVTGSIQECSNWADNNIRCVGACSVYIFKVDQSSVNKEE